MYKLAFLACLAAPCFAVNFTWVQTTSVVTNSVAPHTTSAFASPNTAGNMIVVYNFGCCGPFGGPITDSAGNTYKQISASTINSIWIAVNIVAFTGNQITSQVATSVAAVEYHSTSATYFACVGSSASGSFTGGSFRSTTEALALMLIYNFGTGSGFNTATLTAGTVRLGAIEPGTQGVLAGDNDVSSVSTTYTNSATVTGNPQLTAFLALDTTSPTFCFGTAKNSMTIIQ